MVLKRLIFQETFEKCSIMFEFKEGDPPEADYPQEYMEYFED
jgi:hypothetical protein